MTPVSGTGVVGRFLDAMAAHDWDTMADCVAADVVRVGPFRDEYRGRDDYVRFIRGLLPTLPGYSMKVDRVVYVGALALPTVRDGRGRRYAARDARGARV